MVEKGQLEKLDPLQGKAFRFAPLINRDAVSKGMLGDFVERVFDGSAEAVMLSLFDVAELDAAELAKIVIPRHPATRYSAKMNAGAVNLVGSSSWSTWSVPEEEVEKAKLVIAPGGSGIWQNVQAGVFSVAAKRPPFQLLKFPLGNHPIFAESDVHFTSGSGDSKGKGIHLRSATSQIEVLPAAQLQVHRLVEKTTDLEESERRVEIPSADGVSETLTADLGRESVIDEDDVLSVTTMADAQSPSKYSVLLTLRQSGVKQLQVTVGSILGEPARQLPYAVFADGELVSSMQLKNPNPDNPIVIASGLTQEQAKNIVAQIRKILPQPRADEKAAKAFDTLDQPAMQGDEARSSEIATFESVRQNEDYRITLLGVKKGVDFLDSQELVHDGARPHGKNVVPWMRVTTVIEKLTNKDEPWGFKAETEDGSELVGTINNERNGRVMGSRINGLEEMDLQYPPLPAAIFPAETPKGSSPKTKVYLFTLSGKIQESDTVTLRFWFGDEGDRRELVFKNVPMP